jgi:hypothetical protein
LGQAAALRQLAREFFFQDFLHRDGHDHLAGLFEKAVDLRQPQPRNGVSASRVRSQSASLTLGTRAKYHDVPLAVEA